MTPRASTTTQKKGSEMQKYTVVIYAEAESLEEAQTNAQRMVDNYEGAGWFDLEVVVPR